MGGRLSKREVLYSTIQGLVLFFRSFAELTSTQTIANAVEQYCRNIEALFLAEMFPRPTDYLQPQKSSAWLEKARQLAVQGEKRIEPFNFRPESCVKLNNVEAARKLLDNMYNQIEADKMAEVVQNHGPPVPEKVERNRFLFTVKIVIAEGLVPLDSSPSAKLDTFITLSDPEGHRVAKTRTIYESLNPRCMIPITIIALILICILLQGTKLLTFLLKRNSGSWLASATVHWWVNMTLSGGRTCAWTLADSETFWPMNCGWS